MKPRVMIVDDDQGILEALEIVVAEIGFEVCAIKDAHLVMETVASCRPDLILLDMLLSGVDGRDVIKTLRSTSSTQHIPIILMSADTQVQEKSIEAGASSFLKKPFDLDELEKLMRLYTTPTDESA